MTRISFRGNGDHRFSVQVKRSSCNKPEAMAKIATKKANKDEMQSIAEILKAAAHPDRLAILNLLCKAKCEGLMVKTIYEKLSLQQPVVSRHLNILRSAGVVRRQQEGQKIYYCLCMEKKTVESLSKCFC